MGVATVTGSGSQWNNSSSLSVGSSGTGTLNVADGGVAAAASGITIAWQAGSSGTLNIGRLGQSDTGGTISTPTITFGNGTGAINFNQSDAVSIAATISGAGTLNQLGVGTTTLSGSNTYSGGTWVNAGELVAGHPNAFGTGAVTVNAGGFLNLSNYVVANELFNFGGTICSAGTSLYLEYNATAAVPEPGTWVAAGLLAGGALYARWRKRKVAGAAERREG